MTAKKARTSRRRTTGSNRARGRGRSEPGTPRGGGLQLEQVPLERLHPWEDNPRTMPPAEMESLRRSVSHWGMVQPIVARSADGAIIGGHQRWEAAKALGMARVPVVYVDVSEAEARTLALALNRISGEWDLPRLGSLLEGLQLDPDIEEALTGFQAPEIDDLLAELERQQLPDPREDSFPEAAEALQEWLRQAPTRVSKGETWQLGRHLLYCGDSLAPGTLERLCDGSKVDVVLTDPPYGIGYRSTQARRGSRKAKIANDASEQFDDLLARALPAVKAVMKRGSVMYWFAGGGGAEPVLAKAMLAIAEELTLLNVLVWDKLDPGLGWRWRPSWEAIIEASMGKPRIWHGGTNARNVLRYAKAIPQSDDHPTPKPVPLLEEIILAAAPARGAILDPFAGSGSTLIAAERTGRTCLAAELAPRYCDIALARWEALSGAHAQLAGR